MASRSLNRAAGAISITCSNIPASTGKSYRPGISYSATFVLLAPCFWATTVCTCLMIFEGDTKAYLGYQCRNLLFLKTKRKQLKRTGERAFLYIFCDGL
jgi:hypothetical protein